MHKAALAAAESAHVVTNLEVNEDGPCYVRIEGRKSGLIAWLLTLFGIEAMIKFEVYGDRIECSKTSLSGMICETIPLTAISNLGSGFVKPVFLFVFAAISAAIAVIAFFCNSTGTAMYWVISAVIFVVLYFWWKTMILYFIPNSASTILVKFKRSVIEGVELDENTAGEIIGIVSQLVQKNKAK